MEYKQAKKILDIAPGKIVILDDVANVGLFRKYLYTMAAQKNMLFSTKIVLGKLMVTKIY
jgi:hypothetical protein